MFWGVPGCNFRVNIFRICGTVSDELWVLIDQLGFKALILEAWPQADLPKNSAAKWLKLFKD
jgi:hypothetical protein